MMKQKLIVLFNCFVFCLLAQEPWNPTYKFSEDILSKPLTDSTATFLAWDLSYIGEYEQDIKVWDVGEMKTRGISAESEKYISSFNAINAKSYISEKAKTAQIIIINEAHHQPYHRVFTTSLLELLYKEGYRYFGAETLWEWDTLLNQRKYPSMMTGGYTQESCYAYLVREALRIGYTVFAYESTRMETDSAGINLREVDQARNIKQRVLDKDPKGKILIHCGFGHIVETPVYTWGKAMAGRLKEYTGIDPLTIDQVDLTEHSSPEYEDNFFKKMNYGSYTILLDSLGKPFNGPKGNRNWNISVYHPRTKWISGRPHWMFENGRHPNTINEKIKIGFPCLIFAYVKGEKYNINDPAISSVPFDVIEIKSKDELKSLSLMKGNYIIVVKNKKGEEQKFEWKAK